MEVILREDCLPLGYVGDTVRVKRGYARNYLLPRGLAVEASSTNSRALKHQLAGIMSKRMKKKAEAEQFGAVLSQIIVEFTLKMGAQGKSFGSVTTRDIEASLKGLGYEVDRRQIKLVDAIKGAGLHKAEVRLHSEVSVPLQIKVIAAQPVAAAEGAEGAEKGRGKKKSRKAAAAETEVEGMEDTQTEDSVEEEASE
jgi:large subunit ribosomal protein L9